ncbi:DoxX family protein [Mycobacterium sp. IDR2000157661]|uniref:DoxX family protein n=1 Tax=Mycobacterium sp. IDR2000157661 TaxID=2867005 RepID=UPI001EEBD8A5|nr:DoxX family protein [Mycobacterium sp. IDR2000157661]ULE32251.1 DoxX family membrane protein [Mycobacterium sp. IDR2000157661]
MLIRRIARPMLSAAFIARGVEALRSPKPAADAARPTLEGLSKLPDPVGTNVPANAETVARATAAVQIGGGLLLATGKLPRVASAALALSVVPGSLGGHTFWSETDPQRKADERRAFITDISLIGGLIIAAVDTEGKPSLGWRGRHAAQRVSGAVTAALPAGAAAGGALSDSELADKVGHGLQVGAERGRELAHIARERGAELADVARERGPEFAELARKRSAELADVARQRGPEIAELARKRSAEFADVARDRAPELADNARKRSAGLADAARIQAKTARKQAKAQARTARQQAKVQTKLAKAQSRRLR